MTIAQFHALLKTADTNVRQYAGPGTGNYTIWRRYGRPALNADGVVVDSVWNIQVDRYTKTDADSVVYAIDAALRASDEIAVSYLIDYEQETGYIHHIWDCEVIVSGAI